MDATAWFAIGVGVGCAAATLFCLWLLGQERKS